MRASDDDRAQALTRLGEAYVAGRLTGDEHATRSDAAAEARTREELDALLADLPERRRDEALRLHALAFAGGSAVLLAAWWLTRDDTPLPTDEGAGSCDRPVAPSARRTTRDRRRAGDQRAHGTHAREPRAAQARRELAHAGGAAREPADSG